VGTPDSYWQAHQDILAGGTAGTGDGPGIDLDDPTWPVRTTGAHRPPARIEASASVENSLVSPACRVAGRVVDSVLSPGVVVEEGAVVRASVVLHDAVVRTGALVGAGAVVSDRVEVPSRAMALGIPAKMRLDAVPEGVLQLGADMYVENGRRYKDELRRLD